MTGTAAYAPNIYPSNSPFRTVWSILEAIIERLEAQEQAERIAQTYKLICSESLRLPPSRQTGRRSVITESGIPFEFSFTTADQLGTVRILSEAAPVSEPLANRVSRSVDCLEELIALHGLFGNRPTVRDLLGAILPPNIPAFDSSWPNGALWLSVRFARHQSAVLRVYVNQQWNNNAFRFLKAHKLLQHVHQSRNAERLLGLFGTLEGWADIAGFSFDIAAEGIGGIKLYLGASAATLERIVGLVRKLDLMQSLGQAVYFLRRMTLVENYFTGPCLLLSISFPAEETRPLSLKMDVTTRAVFNSDREVYEAAEDVLHSFRLHAMGYRACEDLFFPHGFPPGRVQILQYVGLALTGAGPPRLNFYLAPPYP